MWIYNCTGLPIALRPTAHTVQQQAPAAVAWVPPTPLDHTLHALASVGACTSHMAAMQQSVSAGPLMQQQQSNASQHTSYSCFSQLPTNWTHAFSHGVGLASLSGAPDVPRASTGPSGSAIGIYVGTGVGSGVGTGVAQTNTRRVHQTNIRTASEFAESHARSQQARSVSGADKIQVQGSMRSRVPSVGSGSIPGLHAGSSVPDEGAGYGVLGPLLPCLYGKVLVRSCPSACLKPCLALQNSLAVMCAAAMPVPY